mmetsp:Transcript_32923/g.77737  ORF Transcript_32923/g.77737 Transcript_32923/m.77737 type:complete len:911 (-) Transcript_32923:272-3004(-)
MIHLPQNGKLLTSLSHPNATKSSSAMASMSFARREALKNADGMNQTRVIDTYPLEKYLIIAQHLFGFFQQAYENLNLNEAYVYGMRYAQLTVKNLRMHREWEKGGNIEQALNVQIKEVLSRLEIIKRKMDEEEAWKMRALVQAEEARKQKLYRLNREAEEERPRGSAGNTSTFFHGKQDHTEKPAKKTKSKLKVFHKRAKKFVKTITWDGITAGKNVEESDGSQVVLSSLGKIRESRARPESHSPNTTNGTSTKPYVPPTQYSVEEYPMVDNVKLKLHSVNTPSLRDLTEDASASQCNDRTPQGGRRQSQETCQVRNKQDKAIYHPPKPGFVKPSPRSRTKTPRLNDITWNYPLEVINEAEKDEELLQEFDMETPHVEVHSSPTSQSSVGTKKLSEECDDTLKSTSSTHTEATQVGSCFSSIASHYSNGAEEQCSGEIKCDLPRTHTVIADNDSTSSPCRGIEGETRERILTGIGENLREAHNEDTVNDYQRLMDEIAAKVSSIYTGDHHVTESVPRNNQTSVNENQEGTHDPSTNDFLSESGSGRIGRNADPHVHESVKNHELLKNSSERFDASAQRIAPTQDEGDIYTEVTFYDEEDVYTEVTVYDEDDAYTEVLVDDEEEIYKKETGESPTVKEFLDGNSDGMALVEGDNPKEECDPDLATKKTRDDKVEYQEYPFVEEGSETKEIEKERNLKHTAVVESKVENEEPKQLTSVKSIAASKSASSSQNKPYHPQPANFGSEYNENLNQLPENGSWLSLTIVDNDEMTCITMDACFMGQDRVRTEESDDVKERTKKILRTLLHDDATAVETALFELNQMVSLDEKNKALFADFGAVVGIIQSMKKFRHNETIQFLSCALLGYLATEPGILRMIENLDAVTLISQSMLDHPSSQRVEDAARDAIAVIYSL